jgi:hypothetical protein
MYRQLIVIGFLLITGVLGSYAQEVKDLDAIDSLLVAIEDSLAKDTVIPKIEVHEVEPSIVVRTDTIVKKPLKDMSKWMPNPKKAMWLALVIPGGGQIYNRKYWKLPIVYGGFIGCLYAMNWNNNMYKDYSQAYLDLTDKDPTTQSYNLFLHLGTKIDDSNKSRYEDIFKKRVDKFRRWRDLSFFVLLGVYALSVIDAYVDAELSNFDISKDLSLKVEPTILKNHSSNNPIDGSSLGLACSLNF